MAVSRTAMLALDCAEPETLAEFYAALLGAEIRRTSDPDLIEAVGRDGSVLGFRRDHGLAPPSWPRPEDAQQAHLLILLPPGDLDEAEREAVSLGATPMDVLGRGTPREARLMSDPAGHSFLLRARAEPVGGAAGADGGSAATG
ncbi:VOC family protein [Streptomyces sp. PKU-MA01144]|uniref:VOC family protein n=1 Tax=Streptomyces sp. PKU-MA01144 TaxID=2729138 RepID=UPI00147ECFE7|nr:VOC family protein [Streptomyces sp. PKU-MA01144]